MLRLLSFPTFFSRPPKPCCETKSLICRVICKSPKVFYKMCSYVSNGKQADTCTETDIQRPTLMEMEDLPWLCVVWLPCTGVPIWLPKANPIDIPICWFEPLMVRSTRCSHRKFNGGGKCWAGRKSLSGRIQGS